MKSERYDVCVAHVDEVDEIDELGLKNAMIAGGLAGMMEHICMFPIDTVKTRMQVVGQPGMPVYRGAMHAFSQIIQQEGLRRLYRGVTAIVTVAIPSHAAYFSTYELARITLGIGAKADRGHYPLQTALAGACATIAHDTVVTPLDVVKQRMQVYHSKHESVVACMRDLVRKDGVRMLYASLPTTLAMNIPFIAMHFTVYESLKVALEDYGPPIMRTHMATHILAGGGAGAVGALISSPMDVVKTTIQVGGSLQGFRSTLHSIIDKYGYRGLFRGVSARMLYFMPSSAICWTTYEFAKKCLHLDTQHDDMP